MNLQGLVLDLGDVVWHTELITKGRRLRVVWHFGAPVKATSAERQGSTRQGNATHFGEVDVMTDVPADKGVRARFGFKDEVGNPVDEPEGATISVTSSDETIFTVGDRDGDVFLAATGTLGSSQIHAEIDLGDGRVITSDGLLTAVAGDAERVEMTFGDPEEVTPDV